MMNGNDPNQITEVVTVEYTAMIRVRTKRPHTDGMNFAHGPFMLGQIHGALDDSGRLVVQIWISARLSDDAYAQVMRLIRPRDKDAGPLEEDVWSVLGQERPEILDDDARRLIDTDQCDIEHVETELETVSTHWQ